MKKFANFLTINKYILINGKNGINFFSQLFKQFQNGPNFKSWKD